MITITKQNTTIKLMKPDNICAIKIQENKKILCIKKHRGLYITRWESVEIKDENLSKYPYMNGEWIYIKDKYNNEWFVNKEYIYSIKRNGISDAIEVKYAKKKFIHIIIPISANSEPPFKSNEQ